MSLTADISKLLSDYDVKLVVDTRTSLQKALDERSDKARSKSKLKGGVYKKPKSRLWASIASDVEYYANGIKLSLSMNDYWDIVNNGRKAGSVSREGQDKIAEWSDTRGLAENIRRSDLNARKKKQSLSERKNLKKLKKMPFDKAKKAAGFLVARALKNKKLEATNFFTDVINDGRIIELETKLSNLIKTDFKIFVTNGIN